MSKESDQPTRRDIIPVMTVRPHDTLSAEDIGFIVEASRNTSLRELVGRRVFQEGEVMLQDYVPTPGFTGETRHDPNYRGRVNFRSVGESILYACALVTDGIAAADTFVATLHKRAMQIFPYNPDMAMTIAVRADSTRRWAPGVLREATESFAIDPSGFDYLKRTFGEIEETPEDGFSRGVNRYKQIYTRAVNMGATPDRSRTNSFHKQLLRIRRRVVDAVGFPPPELYN